MKFISFESGPYTFEVAIGAAAAVRLEVLKTERPGLSIDAYTAVLADEFRSRDSAVETIMQLPPEVLAPHLRLIAFKPPLPENINLAGRYSDVSEEPRPVEIPESLESFWMPLALFASHLGMTDETLLAFRIGGATETEAGTLAMIVRGDSKVLDFFSKVAAQCEAQVKEQPKGRPLYNH